LWLPHERAHAEVMHKRFLGLLGAILTVLCFAASGASAQTSGPTADLVWHQTHPMHCHMAADHQSEF
jgi:hypothetical protein